jgi:hypothetical protein
MVAGMVHVRNPLYEIGNLNGNIYHAPQIKAIDIHIDSRKEGQAESALINLHWV